MKVTAYRWLLGILSVLTIGNPAFAQAPQTRPQTPAQAPQPASHGPGPANGTSPRPAPPSAERSWWHREDFQKEVGLTSEQIVRFDHIYSDGLPQRTEEASQLDEREAQLSRLIEMNADDDRIAHQIDRVETARSLLNKDREMMLVHMRQVLTPDQRLKFNQRWARLREQSQQRPPAQGGPQRSTQPPPSSAAPTKRPE